MPRLPLLEEEDPGVSVALSPALVAERRLRHMGGRRAMHGPV
jgi:hypothetical protein